MYLLLVVVVVVANAIFAILMYVYKFKKLPKIQFLSELFRDWIFLKSLKKGKF